MRERLAGFGRRGPSQLPTPSRSPVFSQRILRGWFITFEYSCDGRCLQNPPPAPSNK